MGTKKLHYTKKLSGPRDLASLAVECDLHAPNAPPGTTVASCAYCDGPITVGDGVFFGGSAVFCARECLRAAIKVGEARAVQ